MAEDRYAETIGFENLEKPWKKWNPLGGKAWKCVWEREREKTKLLEILKQRQQFPEIKIN